MQAVRVDLMRDFEVERVFPRGWVTARDLMVWREEYDRAAVISQAIDRGDIHWRRCFSSDLPRAVLTAEAAQAGEITKLAHVREPEVAEFKTGSLRLPVSIWRWILRLAWLSSHRSQAWSKIQFLQLVRFLRETLLDTAREDTLIVGHAGMMAFLRKELIALGYTGPAFRMAEHAKIYVFERKISAACTSSQAG